MMNKDDFNALNNKDIYSLLLFMLYILKNDEKYSTLSELIYVLDKDSLYKLLQYYGGVTITIPTIEDLELVTQALLLYAKKDLNFVDGYDILKDEKYSKEKRLEINSIYNKLKLLLKDYTFVAR